MEREFSVRYLGYYEDGGTEDGARYRVLWYLSDGTEIRAEVTYDFNASENFIQAIKDVTGVTRVELVQGTGPVQRWYREA